MKTFLPDIKGTPLIETISSPLGPEEVFSFFAEISGSALLASSLETDAARYSFIGVEPFFTLRSKGHLLEFSFGDEKMKAQGDPFELLKSAISAYSVRNDTPFPFISGGIGYFSYDLKNLLEELPRKAVDDLKMPDAYFVFYQGLIIFDRQTPGKIHISALDISSVGHRPPSQLINEIKAAIAKPVRMSLTGRGKAERAWCPSEARTSEDFQRVENSRWEFSTIPEGISGQALRRVALSSNFTKEEYMSAVEKVLEHIKAGDIYQACLSQRFKTKWEGSGYELYRRLNEINPSPFSAYLNAGDHTVISSSPELFLRRCGDVIETRPMKGTRPRGKTSEDDAARKEELKKSQKDISELLMIVDLERNDLGKIAVPGSVKVVEERRIEPYPTVFQTIAVVRGEVKKGTDNLDILKAVFPGGSITGCPKIRAMEIIDDLEPTSRGIYTGAIGYISFHNTMDLNIAIRTMLLKNHDLYFGAGGGIVSDSNPEAEYEETLVKARALIKSLS